MGRGLIIGLLIIILIGGLSSGFGLGIGAGMAIRIGLMGLGMGLGIMRMGLDIIIFRGGRGPVPDMLMPGRILIGFGRIFIMPLC